MNEVIFCDKHHLAFPVCNLLVVLGVMWNNKCKARKLFLYQILIFFLFFHIM